MDRTPERVEVGEGCRELWGKTTTLSKLRGRALLQGGVFGETDCGRGCQRNWVGWGITRMRVGAELVARRMAFEAH